jgi:hypothetical protein
VYENASTRVDGVCPGRAAPSRRLPGALRCLCYDAIIMKNTFPLLSVVALVSFGAAAQGQTISLYCELDGAQAATTSPSTGSATLTLDTAANTLDYTLQFSNLIGTEISAHIHGPADPGEDGTILHGIALGSPISGVWNYPEVFEADILGGRMFINVHSDFIPFGEIRGQIAPTPRTTCECAGLGACGNDDAGAGCANSTGSGAKLSFSGLPSVILDTLRLDVSGLPPAATAIVFMGPLPSAPLTFFDGARCVTGHLFRFPVRQASAGGELSEGPGIAAFAGGAFQLLGQIAAGDTWHFQCWYLDPGGPCGTSANTSNALEIDFTP